MRRLRVCEIDTRPNFFANLRLFLCAHLFAQAVFLLFEFGREIGAEVFGFEDGTDFDFGSGPKGLRLSHSTASSMERTCQSQKPAMSSLVSAKGPSVTVGLAAVKVMRLPLELGWRPSPASITPALTSSSLNLPMLVRSSVLGRMPASESLLALTITMQRIDVSPFIYGWSRVLAADPCSLSL